MMEHFSEQAWADYVRGLHSCDRRDMELHLASGCIGCTRVHDIWSRMHTIALGESLYEIPAHLVHLAKLEFAAKPAPEAASLVLAKLTFDTFAAPALAGVRSTAAAARQMLYETDGLAIDLRFDRRPASKTIHVTGQVLDKQEPYGPLAGATVIVWTTKGLPISETQANALGEFSLQLQPQSNLRLSIQPDGRSPVRISLANLAPETHLDDSHAPDGGNQ